MALRRYPAELEYKRNPKLCKDTIQKIHEWVRKEPHLPDIEEEDVVLFLASCKYDEEYAKKTLDFYYTFRTLHPEFFGSRHLFCEKYINDHQTAHYYLLPGTATDGSKILYSKLLSNAESSKYNTTIELSILLAYHELFLYELGAVPGWRIVYDMQNSRMSMVLGTRISSVRQLIDYFQNACPVKLTGIHLVNPKPYVTFFTNGVLPFLNKSTTELIHIHSKLDEVFEHIPKKILPSDCGGDMPAVKEFEELSRQKILENVNVLIKSQKLTVNEALRPKKPEDEKSKGNSMWQYIWGS